MSKPKRYQIFISSTFRDLEHERSEIQQAILSLEHFPVGMELFPSSTDSSWEVIESVITDSDYYVIVIAGKYGSVGTDGRSFTEMEYDLAQKSGIPTLAFIHGEVGKLERDRTELDRKSAKQLAAFSEKVRQKHQVKFWATAGELTQKIVTSLVAEIRIRPRIGWIRDDGLEKSDLMSKLIDLQTRYDRLREELTQANSELSRIQGSSAEMIEKLVQSLDEEFQLVTVSGSTVTSTFYDVFIAIAPRLVFRCVESEVVVQLGVRFFKGQGDRDSDRELNLATLARIATEFMAHELLRIDTQIYDPPWQLTSLGMKLLRFVNRVDEGRE
ncbi:DUF4062 domain-containing protein [Anatilimnocola sp. NA78]|uniref:DUF4062 domain-containing protein n=1 Tax=Anatilimnocola sp. NA78 TaxID=3415683 RepID=UPI003CE4D80B